MSIDKNTVRKTARLARLGLTEKEEETLAGELNAILSMIGALNAVNTDGVEPMTGVVDTKPHTRPDTVTDGDMPDKILANAPEQAAGFFVVPKVVE